MQLKSISGQTRLILIGFAFSCFGLVNSIAFATFDDVPGIHPNFEAINYVQAQNIVDGYADGMFLPDNLINRAEFTKIIVEAYHQGEANGTHCFPDVGIEWFAEYVCFLKTRNFIAGYPDGSFKPADNINFVEIAKILVNIRGLTVTPDPHFWYKAYVEKLAELHAIPTSITSFSQRVTRGEMAEMVYRLKANVANKPSKTYEQLVIENALPGLPVSLKIPGINVDSVLEYVGLTPQGDADIPKDPDNAAWYSPGPRPGDIGSAVITGHINWYYGAIGVFADLHNLKPGDKIQVYDDKGAIISFVVRETRRYDAAADTTDVFDSNDGKAHLNLITCIGDWNKSAQQYAERLVVFADREYENF